MIFLLLWLWHCHVVETHHYDQMADRYAETGVMFEDGRD